MTVAVVPEEVSDAAAVMELRCVWAENSRAFARYLQAVLDVGERTPTRGAVPEIATALTFTHGRATDELALADTLINHLPAVFRSLATGAIDQHKARVFATYLAQVTLAQAATIAGRLLPHAPTLTTGQLAARLLREIHTIDPDHTRRRYEDGIRNRHLYGYLDTDGTAVLTGKGLPTPDATAAAERLENLAARIHTAGYPATVMQTRADLYLRLLDGTLEGLTTDHIITTMLTLGPFEPAGPPPTPTEEPAPPPTKPDPWAAAARHAQPVPTPTDQDTPDPAADETPTRDDEAHDSARTPTQPRPSTTGTTNEARPRRNRSRPTAPTGPPPRRTPSASESESKYASD